MPSPPENLPALPRALAGCCRQQPLAEKWLLAPSRRVGQQWLDQVARAGQPVVNVRLHTPLTCALELAGPRLGRRQLLSPLGRVVLAGRLLRQLGSGYLGGLRPSLALAERLAATLHDLRVAGLQPENLEHGRFEVAAKGRELIALLRGYRQLLEEHDLVDDADLFRLAGPALPASVMVLAPADLDLGPLQKIPHTVLPVDEPPAPDFTDAFRAVGETSEVREVLRRCLANGWSLDEVEVLHTDTETYVARFYEVCAALEVPVTFAEGIPVRYSRPGRALSACLAWVADDFPQPALVAMIRDGLLEGVPGNLAGPLRVVPIGFGRERYLAQLDRQIRALAQPVDEVATDEDGEARPELRASRERRRQALLALREAVERLLALADRPLLEAAAEFLAAHVRCANELDNLARDLLQRRLAELRSWSLTEEEAREWLPALLDRTRVRGEGPRPGHLYVTRWETGGHSGRRHTFIVGLDADRFPPQGRPDPLLLDSERRALSPELPTAVARREEALREFDRLRARLRGTVTASYVWRSPTDDSEQAAGLTLPASAATAATAPATETAALSESEWWLWRLCTAGPVAEPDRLVGECFPWLGRGLRATFDGQVPEAGPDLDPAVSAERLFSARRLETLGTCPLRYFYRYALGLEEPEELERDVEHWLPAVELGTLLHEVFCRHLRDGVALEEVLQERIRYYREKIPPPNEGVLRRDRRRLERAIRIFAAEQFDGQPVDFEREMGGVPIALPDGTTLHVNGRVDRVDETADGLVLWDYKTGSASRYRPKKKNDPFNGGRILQHAIYIALARAHYGKAVAHFGYFFPTEKGRGERITFTPAQLAEAPALLARLRQLIAAGTFFATDTADDCTFCKYRSICRDVETITAHSPLQR